MSLFYWLRKKRYRITRDERFTYLNAKPVCTVCLDLLPGASYITCSYCNGKLHLECISGYRGFLRGAPDVPLFPYCRDCMDGL